MQYLVGLKRLGFDVYYVEAHGKTPSMLMDGRAEDGAAVAGGVHRRHDAAVRPRATTAGRSTPCTIAASATACRSTALTAVLRDAAADPQPARRHRAAARALRRRPARLRRHRSGRGRGRARQRRPGHRRLPRAALRVLHLGRELRQPRLPRARVRSVRVRADAAADRDGSVGAVSARRRPRRSRRSPTGASRTAGHLPRRDLPLEQAPRVPEVHRPAAPRATSRSSSRS